MSFDTHKQHKKIHNHEEAQRRVGLYEQDLNARFYRKYHLSVKQMLNGEGI